LLQRADERRKQRSAVARQDARDDDGQACDEYDSESRRRDARDPPARQGAALKDVH